MTGDSVNYYARRTALLNAVCWYSSVTKIVVVAACNNRPQFHIDKLSQLPLLLTFPGVTSNCIAIYAVACIQLIAC